MAAPADSSTTTPYHTFPESKFESLCAVSVPLAAIGLFVFGVLHYQSEPALLERHRERSVRGWIYTVAFCYVVPSVFFFATVGSYDETVGAGMIAFAAAIEGAVNLYFFSKNSQHRTFPRLGRRILFVSMSLLLGAGMFTDHYNGIDYYGPVRISSVGLEFYRPEQKIESYNPSYYYYYRLEQTIEWGDTWACPKTSKRKENWCSVMDDLYAEECKKKISCKGRPEDYGDGGKGACASAEQKADALLYLFQCFNKHAKAEGIQPEDFSSTNFTRSVAPWDDPLQPHTVTRAVSCSPKCTAEATAPPETLAREVLVEWLVAGALILVGSVLLVLGVRTGQEQQEARTVPENFQQLGTVDGSYDLELSQNSNYEIPVARAVPIA